ncbi:serine protease [Flavobacterium sp. TSSA_36]|jgi:hypothetical protein|uniref:serine protease n=1 Tax=Flavobacterium sp. TSSA_36 TaxID=3447669 RepID=UPI003F3E9517
MNFMDNYEPLLRAFWYLALPVSIFFLLQTISTFIGLSGAETDTDTDGIDGEMTFEVFTLRNLINFLLGFSWTGISFYNTIENKTILILIALIVGFFFVIVFFLLIKQILKLSEDNSFKIENAINKTAEVYLAIPEAKTGQGKIQISINGAFHELSAITYSPERIATGSLVRVVGVAHHLVIVEKI